MTKLIFVAYRWMWMSRGLHTRSCPQTPLHQKWLGNKSRVSVWIFAESYFIPLHVFKSLNILLIIHQCYAKTILYCCSGYVCISKVKLSSLKVFLGCIKIYHFILFLTLCLFFNLFDPLRNSNIKTCCTKNFLLDWFMGIFMTFITCS